MRIIGGRLKGYHLKAVKGLDIRPTSDLVREAIFSMLESMDVEWGLVVDLYAGSGALGIEALSRGAGEADFVERSQRNCALIRQNLEHTGLTSEGHVYCMSAAKAISLLGKSYNIVFLDPPYDDPSIGHTVTNIAASRLVDKDSTIVVEHSRRKPLETAYGYFCRVKDRRHGDTVVSVYRYCGGVV